MEGWVKLHRKFLKWEWYDDANTKIVFLHLLLTCNHEKKRWRRHEINPGERIIGLEKFGKEIGLSLQQVRTALDKLESTNEITKQSGASFTLVKLNKWDEYQLGNKVNNKRITNEQQTSNKRVTTTKECKNERMKEVSTVSVDTNSASPRDLYENKKAKGNSMSLQDFEIFWNMYPNKVNRKKALEKFLKLNSSLLDAILSGLKAAISSPDWTKDGGKYVPHPTTWINGERWNDKIITNKPKTFNLPKYDPSERHKA